MRKIFVAILAFIFAFNPILSEAQMVSGLLHLPTPGSLVKPSVSFTPTLLRGVTIHPDNPLQFDFIVDEGNAELKGQAFQDESQRMVNYFLAALAVPEKDVWVNLSPKENDRIIPDSLNKTELGRDLLAQDYILKQLTASLIYPEDNLGKVFWAKVYEEAFHQFGVTEIPVDTFNKVWIVPQAASVIEKGNTVFVTSARLKVMLESDYQAAQGQPLPTGGHSAPLQDNQRGSVSPSTLPSELAMDTQATEGENRFPNAHGIPVQDLTKKILREIIVPAIEKEVNEGKNFVSLRQIVYAMVLAQWYQDVFKTSVLNKVYAGQSKMAGIDFNDPKNKQFIYDQYMDAYKKGVFNYIKEEADRLTKEPLPKKYFSGGFAGQKVARLPAEGSADQGQSIQKLMQIKVVIKEASDAAEKSTIEPHEIWNEPDRAIGILAELKGLWKSDSLDTVALNEFLDKYKAQVEAEAKLYPVESVWPILKAFALLTKQQKQEMVDWLKKEYEHKPMTFLVEGILVVNNVYSMLWAQKRTPLLAKSHAYLVAAEIHHWAGGLGPVMKFLGKMLKELGVSVSYLAPWYQFMRQNGETVPLDYLADSKVTITNENYDEFYVDIGSSTDENKVHRVRVQVAEGVDENGVKVHMVRDIGRDGKSYYTHMLYNYDQEYNNFLSKEKSMAFINVAMAKFLLREEQRRKKLSPDAEPAVVHANDGQLAPLQAVTMSHYGQRKAIKDIVWGFTTHTYINRGSNEAWWGIPVFLNRMMRISGRFLNYFRNDKTFGPRDGSLALAGARIDHTSGGMGPADVRFAVAAQHRDRVSLMDPRVPIMSASNGSAPEEMAYYLHEELKKINADLSDPTAQQMGLGKKASKEVLNDAAILRNNGAVFKVDPDAVFISCARRGVVEKSGIENAFTRRNVFRLVQGILDRPHLERLFAKRSDIGVDGGAIFDWLLQAGYLQKVKIADNGRYMDTDQEFSTTEARLLPLNLNQLIRDLENHYEHKTAGEIWAVLKRVFQRKKANVGPFLNDQGSGSVGVMKYFAGVEKDFDTAIMETPEQFTGTFQFVSSFNPVAKKKNESAADVDVKSSWLGANEVTEEDIAANGGIQIGSDEGTIIRQGIRLTTEHSGNVIEAKTEDDYWEAYLTILEMTPEELSENERVSYQLGRTVMLAVRTASANALAYEEGLARKKRIALEDRNMRRILLNELNMRAEIAERILEQGQESFKTSFVFLIQDKPDTSIDPENKLNGLRRFLEIKNMLEELYGEDALLGHFQKGDFQKYLMELFAGLPAQQTLQAWLQIVAQSDATEIQKYLRFSQFLDDLEVGLEDIIVRHAVSQEKAKELLDQLGGGHFVWKDREDHEVFRNGAGLKGFVIAFDAVSDNEDVMRFHSMAGESHILRYLSELLKDEPLLASLKYKIDKRLEIFSKIPKIQIESKIDLTFEAVNIVKHSVDVLERIADPGTLITKGPVDNAAITNPGGIDLNNMQVAREGDLVNGVISDKALEEMLTHARGLQGIIVSITPITDFGALLR